MLGPKARTLLGVGVSVVLFANLLAYTPAASLTFRGRVATASPHSHTPKVERARTNHKAAKRGRARTVSTAVQQGAAVSQKDLIGWLLQLHVAEYQAIRANSTNWTTLQYGLATFTVAALGLIIANLKSFSSGSGFAVWAMAILYQFVMMAHLLVLSELFNNIRYLECELRPRVQLLVAGTDPLQPSSAEAKAVWQYEHFKSSASAYGPVGDYLLPLQSFLAMMGALWWRWRRRPWSSVDWLLLVSLLILGYSLKLTHDVGIIHDAYLACAAK